MSQSDMRQLVGLIRAIVKSTVDEAIAKTRTTGVLSGTVEDLDDDLDIAYTRMDSEAMGGDPTESDNYEMPGVIATTRAGRTFRDEQVRVNFDGSAGATANHVGVESRIVLPFGKESGLRIILDGDAGTIEFYDQDDELVGYLDSTQWRIGKQSSGLARLDPIAGLRLRDNLDRLRSSLSPTTGLEIFDPDVGSTAIEINKQGVQVVDSARGERIKLTYGDANRVPDPRWAGVENVNPGSTHPTPAVLAFTFGLDALLRFSVASTRSVTIASSSFTPPSGYTELADLHNLSFLENTFISMGSTVAIQDSPTSNDGIQNFTSSASTWQRQNGHSVMLHGDPDSSSSGAFARSEKPNAGFISDTAEVLTLDIEAPETVEEDDLVIAFVAVASSTIPVGWTTPDGWQLVGVQVSGLGTENILASGVWYKIAGASEPASEQVVINMGEQTHTMVQATTVSVGDCRVFDPEMDIQLNQLSLPRGQVASNFVSSIPAMSSTTTNTDIGLTNVQLRRHRNYQFILHSWRISHNVSSSPASWDIWVRSGGSDFRQLGRVRHPQNGLWVMPFVMVRTFRPLIDETLSFNIRFVQDETGSVLSAAQTRFSIVDVGSIVEA